MVITFPEEKSLSGNAGAEQASSFGARGADIGQKGRNEPAIGRVEAAVADCGASLAVKECAFAEPSAEIAFPTRNCLACAQSLSALVSGGGLCGEEALRNTARLRRGSSTSIICFSIQTKFSLINRSEMKDIKLFLLCRCVSYFYLNHLRVEWAALQATKHTFVYNVEFVFACDVFTCAVSNGFHF